MRPSIPTGSLLKHSSPLFKVEPHAGADAYESRMSVFQAESTGARSARISHDPRLRRPEQCASRCKALDRPLSGFFLNTFRLMSMIMKFQKRPPSIRDFPSRSITSHLRLMLYEVQEAQGALIVVVLRPRVNLLNEDFVESVLYDLDIFAVTSNFCQLLCRAFEVCVDEVFSREWWICVRARSLGCPQPSVQFSLRCERQGLHSRRCIAIASSESYCGG